MNAVTDQEITTYLEGEIYQFHVKSLKGIEKLQLKELLERKNPYLYQVKNITSPADLIRSLVNARISSQEETRCGNMLEGLAVYISEKTYGGYKSIAKGVDLEFSKGQDRYIVAIKSGPNWCNSTQIKSMERDFSNAKRLIRQGNRTVNVIPVNGCCYGKDSKPDKGRYFKYCGQDFWELISGRDDFYKRILELVDEVLRHHTQKFSLQYEIAITRLTNQFIQEFCTEDGSIDWNKWLDFVSKRRE